MPGTTELLIVLAIVLVVFGANKLPSIGDALGRSIKNFRRATKGADELEVNKTSELDGKDQETLPQSAVEEADVVAKD